MASNDGLGETNMWAQEIPREPPARRERPSNVRNAGLTVSSQSGAGIALPRNMMVQNDGPGEPNMWAQEVSMGPPARRERPSNVTNGGLPFQSRNGAGIALPRNMMVQIDELGETNKRAQEVPREPPGRRERPSNVTCGSTLGCRSKTPTPAFGGLSPDRIRHQERALAAGAPLSARRVLCQRGTAPQCAQLLRPFWK
jgi:hypothetical protein